MTLRHLALCLALLPACGSTDDGATTSEPAAGGHAGSAGAATAGHAGSAGTAGNAGGAGATTCAAPPQPQAFEAGTGQQCFERLTNGQTVTVIQGPQGGFHIWLAVGCSDCGANPFVELGVKDLATGAFYPGYPGPQKQVVSLDGGAWAQRAGLTALLPGMPWDQGSQLPKGTHVLLSASVLDVNTNEVRHTSDVEVVLGDIVQWNPCNPDPNQCGQPGGAPCCTKGGVDGTN